MNQDKIAGLIRQLLTEIGEDPDREGLQDTPTRAAKAWGFLSAGYRDNLEGVINNAIFTSEANNMIILRDIEVYSLCEHHLLPFYGKCHVGYIARDKVLGGSKIARIVDHFSRGFVIARRPMSGDPGAGCNAGNGGRMPG